MNSASATSRCRALLHHFSFLICKHESNDVSRMSAGLGEVTHMACPWGSAVDASCCDRERETFLCLCCWHTDLEGMDWWSLLPLYWSYSGVSPKSHFHYLLVCLARLLLTHRFHMALGSPRVATVVLNDRNPANLWALSGRDHTGNHSSWTWPWQLFLCVYFPVSSPVSHSLPHSSFW